MAGKISQLTAAATIDRTADQFEVNQGGVSKRVIFNTALGFTGGAPVSTADTQTISNKTFANTNTITVKASLFTLQDASDTTKQAQFVLSGITTGTTRLFTLPNANGTLVDLASSQTLVSKTLTSPTINTPTINNPTLNTDSINEFTSSNGVTVAGMSIKSGKLNTNNSVVTANITDAAVTPAKLLAGTGSGWAWSTWAPSWVNLTVGNGVLGYAKYIQIGKLVHARIFMTLGSTSAVTGNISFSLPVTGVSAYADNYPVSGAAQVNPTGGGIYPAYLLFASTSTVKINVWGAAGTYADNQLTSATVPATWAVNGYLKAEFSYEAA